MKITVQTNEKYRVKAVEKDSKSLNWIERYQANNLGDLPVLPNYLLPVVQFYVPGAPVSGDLQVIAPSGQYWQSLRNEQQAELLELVNWTGQDVDDYIRLFESQYPKDPKR